MLSSLTQPLSSSLLQSASDYGRGSSAPNSSESQFSWAASDEGSRGPESWADAESAPSTPRMYPACDAGVLGLPLAHGAVPASPAWEPGSPASTSSSLDGSAGPACAAAGLFSGQMKQAHDIKWKSSPPAQLELALGAEYLHHMLAHLPLDSRHWRQLEQLLENRDVGILHCIINNYLQYEHPAKWEARKDCQVVNVAGYLNRNIRQKVQMLRNRPELVTLVLQMQIHHPEIAQHLDGRMLQYLHDHLDADDISRFGEFAVGALGQDWSVGVVSPRVVLHFVVKSYIQSVKERQCCWQKADEILLSLHTRLQQQPQMLQHAGLYQMGVLGC